LTLGSNDKNVDTQKHKSIRARRDCESERARQSGCRLSVACETQTKYTRQQLRRQETGDRLREREITDGDGDDELISARSDGYSHSTSMTE